MRRSYDSFVLAFAVTAALACTTSVARAGDTSTAENLFSEGMKAMQREDYDAACRAFAGSDQADPSPGTEINLAACNEKQGKLATAWGWYRTAAGLADQRGQQDRAERARAQAARLEPLLAKLRLTTKDPASSLKIVRNGVAVPTATIGLDTPVDPGTHTFDVTADGKKPWHGTVEIPASAGVTSFEIPALEAQPASTGTASGNATGTTAPPDSDSTSDGKTQRLVGFIVGGAGIVLGGAALVTQFAFALPEDNKRKDLDAQIEARSKANTLSPGDYNSLATSRQSHADAAKTDQIVAISLGIAGVAAIGVGTVLVLTAPSGKKTAGLNRPFVYPLLGSGVAGAGLSTTF